MTDKLFTSSERKAIKKLARSMRYSSLRAYLRWLVEMDAKKHGAPSPLKDDELEHPAESFRRAWIDGMAHDDTRRICMRNGRRRLALSLRLDLNNSHPPNSSDAF